MRGPRLALLAVAPLALSGCLAKTAFDVATAPVRVASKAVDLATTSQDESDRNYGRKMRKAEAREGRERREFEKQCRRDPETDECGRGYQGYIAGRDD